MWKFLFPAMVLPAALYIAWDAWFTSLNVWSFNEKYISGWHIGNLPVEEILFFFVVPYCCVFIYECIRTYFPGIKNSLLAQSALLFIGLTMLIIGMVHNELLYTAYTFIALGLVILIVYFAKKFFRGFNAAYFLVSYAVIIIPFLVINGLLTALPVVEYNEAENLGRKLYTIPIEDIFYGMLLILLNIAIYEKLKHLTPWKKNTKHP